MFFISLLHFFFILSAQSGEVSTLNPPKVIYHFGRREFLLEDIELQTIPSTVWKNSIMGSNGRFSLKPFRRGLYGTDQIAYADYYGTRMAHESKNLPYFMAITIKDSCRSPENTVGHFYQLDSDPKFLIWFKRQRFFKTLNDFKTQCLTEKEDDYGGLVSNLETVSSDYPENNCEKTIQAFLNERKIKLVLDMAWKHSWAIRDRDCIEKIEGNPVEIMNHVLKNAGSLSLQPEKDETREGVSYYPKGFGTLLTLLQAIEDLQGKSDSLFLKSNEFRLLKEKLKRSDLSEAGVVWTAFEAAERCANQDRFGGGEGQLKFKESMDTFLNWKRNHDRQTVEDLQLELNQFKSQLNSVCESFLISE